MEELLGHTFREEEKQERRYERYQQMEKDELVTRVLRAKVKVV